MSSKIMLASLIYVGVILHAFAASATETVNDVCSPNPCSDGEYCKTISIDSYHCRKCPYPTSGPQCKYLNCGAADQCFRLNETAYFVFEKRLTWDQANQLCVEQEMQLALLKDKRITDAVTNTLATKYANNLNVHLWFGLRNDGNDREWRWIDGSAFGGYTGAVAPYTPFKIYIDLERCALMFFLNGHLTWSPHPCTYLNEPFQHYPLCQFNISNY